MVGSQMTVGVVGSYVKSIYLFENIFNQLGPLGKIAICSAIHGGRITCHITKESVV